MSDLGTTDVLNSRILIEINDDESEFSDIQGNLPKKLSVIKFPTQTITNSCTDEIGIGRVKGIGRIINNVILSSSDFYASEEIHN